MAISYFDAPAGSGKTHVLVKHAHHMAEQGQKILFVQPSRELISRTTSETLEPLGGSYKRRAIHGDTHGGNVVAAIVAHFRETARNQGEILFITHAAFLLLPFLERAGDWMVIVDEVLSVDVFESFNIPDTHRLITDALVLAPAESGYGRLLAGSRSASTLTLDQIARNSRSDQVLSQFSGIAHRVLSDDWEVHANRDNFERLTAGEQGGQLQTYSLLGAGIFGRFAEAIVASACFTDSMLYRLWSARGVQMQPVGSAFFEALRYQQHGNGACVTIRYVLDEHWSKTKRSMGLDGGGTLGEAIILRVGEVFEGAPFVWMGNKDQSGAFDHLSNATQLPNSPHGRNDFQHFHNVVVLSALNPPPTHFAFMDSLGVGSEALKAAHYRSAVYQAVMRTSIRNPHDFTPKTVIVMDRPTAHWLADCFPGARVEQLNINVALPDIPRGRPRIGAVPLSNAERVRRCRQRKRYTPPASATTSYGSVFPTKFASTSTLQLELGQADDDGFISLLADLHQRVVPSKDDNLLISPATFDADIAGVPSKRGLENVTKARGIWLDFDDGDLTNAEFAAVFPAFRFAAFNTYSSTAANNRWRAFIPTSRDMSADEYATMARQIERRLVDSGWDIANRRHGLDASKMHAASLFYAPCQAAEQAASFFCDHSDVSRAALDVDCWLPNSQSPFDTHLQVARSATAQAEIGTIEGAISAWRAAPAGSGRKAFFVLARRLQRAGMSPSVLETLLKQEVQYARSPNERRAEIAGLLRGSLRRLLGRDC